MHLTKKDNKQRLWYLIFAVCLTVLLLYINFPSEALTNYIRVEAEKRFPGINIGFDKIGLTLSPGIKIRGLRISSKEDPDIPVYVSEKTSISVSIIGWLKDEPKYYFKSKVKGGEISGFLEEKNEVKKERVDATINIEGISLDENIFIHPIINERLEGRLTGKITFMGNLSSPLRGNTELSFNIVDGKFKFKKQVLNLDALQFKKMDISGVIDNRRLNIKDLILTGGPISGSATGTVRIDNNLLNSKLNLKAELEPSPSLSREMPEVWKLFNIMKDKMKNGKLPVDFQGTLGRPIPKFR